MKAIIFIFSRVDDGVIFSLVTDTHTSNIAFFLLMKTCFLFAFVSFLVLL